LAILLALDGEGRLVSTDMPYVDRRSAHHVGRAVPDELRSTWTLLRGPDRRLLPRLLRGEQLDLVHYDSDKSYEGRMWAYPRLWRHVSDDGVLISDDIGDNAAFVDFCADRHLTPLLVRTERSIVGVIDRRLQR